MNQGEVMRQKRQAKRSKAEKYAGWLFAHWTFAHEVTSGLIGIAISLLGILLSFYIAKSKSPRPLLFSTAKTFAYFAGSIVLLEMITVAVASVMRHKHRDVIRLKERLAEIYLVALKQSALNPQLKFPGPND
jgi:hypothetical protein